MFTKAYIKGVLEALWQQAENKQDKELAISQAVYFIVGALGDESAQPSVQRTACRLGDDPIHYGPFVHTPEGKSKCTNCGETW